MKYRFLLTALLTLFAVGGYAQIYSFETPQAEGWSAEDAALSYSKQKFKVGETSLRIDWQPGAVVRIGEPMGLEQASRSPNGGIALWIYNERPVGEPLRIVFGNAGGEVCRVTCGLDFRGWRCVWNTFREDMGKDARTPLSQVELRFPATAGGGTTFLDYLQFTNNVSWQKMSDAQVEVHRTDFSLIPDFMKYRRAGADLSKSVPASQEQIATIAQRLERWYLGSGQNDDAWVARRRSHEADFISRGVEASRSYKLTEPLFPMRTPATIDAQRTIYFMDVNKFVLLPLALDYRKNGSRESLGRALKIYDWFNDQGWADGSALGSLCFEKLRSAGYFHSLYLLRDEIPSEVLERELGTLRWLTMFGICYLEPEHPGEVADNLRALALPKLIYALLQPGERERQMALTAFRDYMDNALGFGPGYFGTFKSDFSGYHHRGAYNSAYYPHALYVGALVAYLLHDTPYALSEQTLHNLRQGLLTYRFFCAELCVPAATVGRFPLGQEVLQELLPAFCYAAHAFPAPDAELLAAAKRLMQRHPAKVEKVLDQVDSDLSYTATVGEAQMLATALHGSVAAEQAPAGSLFMPYSGLLVVKNPEFHFNVKGFSKYIWDYETSDSENLAGRYLSNGQVEYFDLKSGVRSFNPQDEHFDWSLIPGTTSILLPYGELCKKEHRKGFSDHRNYSDESFLAGVTADEQTAMFSFRMHDRAYDGTFRANKSVLFFDDVVLCMGSDIRNDDAAHATATTLFQSCGKGRAGRVRRVPCGSLVTDHAGIVYAVQQTSVTLDEQGPFTRAWIDHGAAPQGAEYLYCMVTGPGRKGAERLLGADAPFEVVRRDNQAHIVRLKESGTLFAALYDARAEYAGMPVSGVNIPLAYIFRREAPGAWRLSLCEPDMRRPSVDHMGQLTEAQVVVEEEPHATRLRLPGRFDAVCEQGDLRVTHTEAETVLELTTVRGRNYHIRLTQ